MPQVEELECLSCSQLMNGMGVGSANQGLVTRKEGVASVCNGEERVELKDKVLRHWSVFVPTFMLCE